MHFKLIIAFVEDDKTDLVLDTARDNGAKARPSSTTPVAKG